MINNIFKFVAKWLLMFVFWTFVFSIQINNKTIFNHANTILVKNSFVQAAGTQMANLWHKLSESGQTALKDISQSGGKKS